jgi:hypothetical protein
VALIVPGEEHTAFTGRFLRLLNNGVPGGPELLTIDDLYQRLLDAMTSDGLPKPQKRATHTADLLALTQNRAYTATVLRPDKATDIDDPLIALHHALTNLGCEPEQIETVLDYIAGQGLGLTTARVLLFGPGQDASDILARIVLSHVAAGKLGDAVRRLPEATRKAAAYEAGATAAKLLEVGLINGLIAQCHLASIHR